MKVKMLLLAMLGIMMPALVQAQDVYPFNYDFEEGGICYEKTSEATVKVVKPGERFAPGKELVIPQTVEQDGITYRVTEVGYMAFANYGDKMKFSSVNLPEGLEVIGEHAFDLCLFSGQTLRLPSTLREIRGAAFNGTHLSAVSLPEGLEVIGDYAFSQCGLREVVIPSTVREIGSDNPFQLCNLISSMSVAEGNRYYDSREDCQAIIETATDKIVAGCKATEIPRNVRAIGNYAFYSMGQDVMIIPANVAEIGIKGIYNGMLEHVYCYREEPPAIDMKSSDALAQPHGTLHVPVGTLEAYRSAPGWSYYFTQIVEMGNNDEPAVDGISQPSAAEEQGDVTAYSLDGRAVKNAQMPKGIIIRNGKKMIVK